MNELSAHHICLTRVQLYPHNLVAFNAALVVFEGNLVATTLCHFAGGNILKELLPYINYNI
jgi:hypothetical protein